MSLTRAMLKGMGLTDEQVSAIIEAHTDTTDALKQQRDQYKEAADQLAETKAELEKMQGTDGDWKAKYESEKADFEKYKSEREADDVKKAKTSAYTDILKEMGVSEKRINSILKLTDLNKLELDSEGNLGNLDTVKENIRTEWSDFIVSENTQGASTSNPPETHQEQTDLGQLSMADYIKARKAQK